jgi:hypothetical protein
VPNVDSVLNSGIALHKSFKYFACIGDGSLVKIRPSKLSAVLCIEKNRFYSSQITGACYDLKPQGRNLKCQIFIQNFFKIVLYWCLDLIFLCRPTTLYINARAVERQSAIYTENSGFASPTLGQHISTFRGYRILFSIRNSYINPIKIFVCFFIRKSSSMIHCGNRSFLVVT